MSFVLAVCLAALAQAPAPVESVSTMVPRSPDEERRALHVPEGFEVQLVAAEPDIQKPMNLAFDDRGRLWVTGSYEYPFPAGEGATPRDTVKVLEDFGPDGRARKVTTFADGLNIPIGLLPLPGGQGALVYSIPSIDRLLDTDGDGKADRRETLYRRYGSKDTHGMTNSFTWGFDGWVYACHGFANDSAVRGADDATLEMNSGNVYRLKVDGSHAESFTRGQVNPFGLAFDPLGNLYSSDCHSRPLYQLLRGAWYPSFGKPDDGLGFGPDMMAHDHGSTAIDGATYYAADHFPEAYRDTLFVGNVMTNRVNHDRLEWRGSSPRAIAQPDFVWSEDNWFRPVDIELGPDGALYIADFYNRIIGHYEVPLTHPGRDHEHGRIWRIVYRGPDGKGEPRAPRLDWTRATIDELIEDLGHPNLAARTRAANQLVGRDDEGIAERLRLVVTGEGNPWRRVHALWVLHRMGRLKESTLRRAMEDRSRELRVHAMRVFAEQDYRGGLLSLLATAALEDPDPLVRRTAAEALGRHPHESQISPLLELRQSTPAEDTHLIHVVRMALRDHLRDGSAWHRLPGPSLSERDARDVADVAPGVPSAEAASYLLFHILQYREKPATLVRYVHHIARYGSDASQVGLSAFVRSRSGEGPRRLAALLKAVQQGAQERGAEPSRDVRDLALTLTKGVIDWGQGDEVQVGINLVAPFKLTELREAMEGLVDDPRLDVPSRTSALTALVTLDPKASLGMLGRVLADAAVPVAVRDRAATSLAGIDQPEARAALLEVLPTAPERLQTTIAAGLAARKPGAEALLQAIAAGKASARLLQQPRVVLLLHFSALPDVKARVEGLLKGLPPADQRLQELLKRRREGFASARGDAGRGTEVFRKNCAACHQVGGEGQRIGPQLDGVGLRGIDRLLEDILDPNRNVDQAFRSTTLALADGQVVSGLLLSEEGAVLVLADSQGKEVRVPKDSVEERTTSQLSPMPANLADQVPEAEFYDLLAFLLGRRERPEGTPPTATGR